MLKKPMVASKDSPQAVANIISGFERSEQNNFGVQKSPEENSVENLKFERLGYSVVHHLNKEEVQKYMGLQK